MRVPGSYTEMKTGMAFLRAVAHALCLVVVAGTNHASAQAPVGLPALESYTLRLRAKADSATVVARLTRAGAGQIILHGRVLVARAAARLSDSVGAWRPEVDTVYVTPTTFLPPTPPPSEMVAHAQQGIPGYTWDQVLMQQDTLCGLMWVCAQGVHVGHIDTGLSPGLGFRNVGWGWGFNDGQWVNGHFTSADSATFADDNPGCNGHGTHTGGTIAGLPWGIAQEATIHSMRVSPSGPGANTCGIPGSKVAWAVCMAADSGVRIVNISLGNFYLDQSCIDQFVHQLHGGFLIIASGNNSGDVDEPANQPGAIAIGAVSEDLSNPGWSDGGPLLWAVQPGNHIRSDSPCTRCPIGSDASDKDGTSMAAPHEAAKVALVLTTAPNLSLDSAKALETRCARDVGLPGRDDNNGIGVPQALCEVRVLETEWGWPLTQASATVCDPGTMCMGFLAASGTHAYDVIATLDGTTVPWVQFTYAGRRASWVATPPLGVDVTKVHFTVRGL